MSDTKSPHPGLTRRSFLKTTGAVAGATALAGAATPVMHALAADASAPDEDTGEKVIPGRCYFGGCFSCNYNVTVRDGHAVKVTPDPDALYGRRPCLRGLSQMQRLYSNDRIKYPMRRVGERGSGEWERISWEEAIDEIATAWKKAIEEHGGRSNAFMGASGGARYLSLVRLRLANLLEMTSFDLSVDWAFYNGLHRVYGTSSAATMTTPGNDPFEEDVFNAKTIMLWGHNLSEAYLQRWRYVMEAREKGAKLVSIDPNQTLTATRSDRWFAPRPGTDPALYLAMSQAIIDEGLHDIAYLKSDTVGPYLVREDTGLFLRMSDLGVAPTEGPVNPTTRKPTIIDPPAVWDSLSDTVASSAEVSDPVLEGSWVIDGITVTTAFSLLVERLEEYVPEKMAEVVDLSAEDIRELARLAADGPVSHMTGMGAQAYVNGLHVGTGLATLVAVTGMVGKPGAGVVSAAAVPPRNTVAMLFPTEQRSSTTSISVLEAPKVIKDHMYNGKEYPPIKTLFISGGGLVGGGVNLNSTLSDIIDQMDFVACADIVFSDSARWSDIVLPVAHTFEIEDCYTGGGNSVLHYGNRVVDPAFEAKTDQEIASLIAEKMGLGEYFGKTDEEWLRLMLATPLLEKQGITLDALRKEKFMRYEPAGISYADGKYHTSTGKVEIYSEKPSARMEFGQERNVDDEHLPRFVPPFEAWPESEAVSHYPLQLISERSRNRWHSQGFDGAWLGEISPEPTVRMNADDAEARGIASGDYVEVYNDRGHAVAKASICAGMRPGMMSYPKGFQTHQYKAGNFSELSHAAYDPYAVSASFFDVCVEARRWEEGE